VLPITKLQKFPKISPPYELDLEDNQLESIPGNLPDAIEQRNLPENRLSILPNHLPVSLRRLDLQDNQLHTLPVSIRRLSRVQNEPSAESWIMGIKWQMISGHESIRKPSAVCSH